MEDTFQGVIKEELIPTQASHGDKPTNKTGEEGEVANTQKVGEGEVGAKGRILTRSLP